MPRIKYKEAAGIQAKRGRPAIGRKPSKTELQKLYIEESKSIREVADQLGCSKDMVYRALKEYGIKVRPNSSRSKLRAFNLGELEAWVKAKGFRGVAKDFEIHENTLRHYVKRAREWRDMLI